MKPNKFTQILFALLVLATLLTPFWVFKALLFPFVTSKAYYLRILVEATLPLYLYLILKYKDFRPNLKNPLSLFILAFLVINVVSAAFGVNPLRSFWGNFERMGGVFYLAHLVMLYFYVLLLGQMGQSYLKYFILGVIWLGSLVSLDGIMIELTHNHFLLNDPSFPRVSGTFGNPIFIASFLILPMFFTLYYLVIEEQWGLKILYAFFTIIDLYVIVISETRGAIVGLALGVFLAAIAYVVFTHHKKFKLWGSIAIVLFTVLMLIGFSQHNKFPASSSLHRIFNLQDSNTEARIIQWGIALRGYKERPILGVGAEDYYVISNKYYNPTIYQYDPSWFDKPHNYFIEVLVTNGALGFIAYLGMLVVCIWALYRAYKAELLSLLESCLLLAGFLAYLFQNLFVFDTVSASLAFYIFVGFCGFLWHATSEAPAKKKHLSAGFTGGLPVAAAGVCLLVMIYVVYVGNVLGLRIAKGINYGYAYGSVDPVQAKNYFTAAQNLPFNFDPIQFSSKYDDFAISLAQNPGNQPASFVSQNLQDAIDFQKQALAAVPTDPTGWISLAQMYTTQSSVEKTPLNPDAVDAANQALALAPKRPEPQTELAQIYLYQNNLAGAEQTLQKLIQEIPLNSQAEMQLALIYSFTGPTSTALQYGLEALQNGFKPSSPAQVDWIAQIYIDRKDWANAEKMYQLAVTADPNDYQDYINLAKVYANEGQKDRALALLQNLLKAEPSLADQIQPIITVLQMQK